MLSSLNQFQCVDVCRVYRPSDCRNDLINSPKSAFSIIIETFDDVFFCMQTFVRSNSYQGDERSAVMSLMECHVVERNDDVLVDIDIYERVALTEKVWHLGPVSRAAAIYVLQNRPDGVG